MPRVQKIDEEVSFNFFKDHNTQSQNNETSDDDDTINYSLTNYSVNQDLSDNVTLKESSVLSESSQSLVIGKIPVTIISRAVDTKNSSATPTRCRDNENHNISIEHPDSVYPSTPKSKWSLGEKGVIDRFEGIFYHIFPKDGQVNIVFPKFQLYDKFIESLCKELRAITSNKDKKIFITHVRGHRCVITCIHADNTIIVSGEGYMLWRESAFIRFTLGLYRYFTSEIDKELSQSHTSTPVIKRQKETQLPEGTSPVLAGNDLSDDKTLKLLNEIKRQVSSLQLVTHDIEEKVLKCHDKIDRLSSKSCQQQATESPSNQALTEPATQPGTSSYSQVLENRAPKDNTNNRTNEIKTKQKSSLKDNRKSLSAKQPTDTSASPPSEVGRNIQVVINGHSHEPGKTRAQSVTAKRKILLMGDSILNKISTKGLKDNIHKHAIPGATLPTLIKDIDLYDLMNFESIIVYIGGNDSAGNVDLGLFEHKYEQLITTVKSRNPSIRLVLCNLAPRGDTDVTFVNKIIERLSFRYNCDLVDEYRAFFDGKGKLIMRYFGPSDQIHPSVIGTRRILGQINDKLNIVSDFAKCTFPRSRNDNRNSFTERNGQYGNRSVNQSFSENNGRCLNCYDPSHETYRCRHKRPVVCWLCGLTGHKQQFCWNTY
ncbi:MAG: SGNH/GDSL hydrolase family protein [Candidatus Thiodiazotropha sp.]